MVYDTEHTQVIDMGRGVGVRRIRSVGLDLGLLARALANFAAKSGAWTRMVCLLPATVGSIRPKASIIVQLLPVMLDAARGGVFANLPRYTLQHPTARDTVKPHGRSFLRGPNWASTSAS